MELRKLVLHYTDGTVGAALSPAFPDGTDVLQVETLEGRRLEVALSDLKAAFFVKTFTGDSNYDRDAAQADLRARTRGRFVRVSFRDGEVLVGEVNAGADLARGFFLQVLDPNDNNVMVYVNPGFLRKPPEE